jgi:gem associated protein 5
MAEPAPKKPKPALAAAVAARASDDSHLLLPASPNWYLPRACDASADIIGFAARSVVVLLRATDRRSIGTLQGHTERVTAFAFLLPPTSDHAATGSADKSVRVWSVFTRVAIATHRAHGAEVVSLSASAIVPDLLCSVCKNTLVCWRYRSGGAPQPYALATRARSQLTTVACSPVDPSWVAVGFSSGALWIVDSRDGNMIHRLSGHEDEIQSLCWSPRGKFFLFDE